MISKPKISVIIPVYNTEKFLSKCLDSVLNQTLEEIEIIVVNDGSPDSSQKIIDDYANQFSKIKAFQKENGGLSDARNYGIEKAKAEYIAFVDSDDFIDENMMKSMYELGTKHDADIVLCDLEKVNENGIAFRALPQLPQLPEKIDLEKDFSLFGEISCFACNKIFKRQLFENHRFKKGIHFEDIELIPKLILDSKIISKINQPFYKYFERSDSITKTHTDKGLDMFFAIDSVGDYFDKSAYKEHQNELKRFRIIQGYYSYLAYVAYVKDKDLRKRMLKTLSAKMKNYSISKSEILKYERFNENYLLSLPLKKKIYYLASFVSLSMLNHI